MKTDDTAWIRARLEAWGIWVNFDENLPPHARLRTGGGDRVGDDRDNEDTNHAIICIRKYYPAQAYILDFLYVPNSDGHVLSVPEILASPDKMLKLGKPHKREVYKIRKEAEKNVGFFLMGRRTDRGEMPLPRVRIG